MNNDFMTAVEFALQSPARRQLLIAGASAAGAGFAPLASHAQEYPSKPILLVVPFGAGGAADVTARRVAEALGKSLGTTVIVDNKPSAGALIATSLVARAPKDGYTMLFSTTNPLSLNPFIYKSLPYKVEDIAPVSAVSRQSFVLVANTSVPFRTVPEFAAWAKAQTAGVQVGTTGLGTTTHILAEWISQVMGFKLMPVPYKGSAQATIDLIGGRIPLQMDGLASAVQLHRGGKVRIVASMGEDRHILPDGVPNFREAGYPQLVAYAEFGLMAPAGTPEPVLLKIQQAIAAIVKQPEFSEKLAGNGETAFASASPKEYAERIEGERGRWSRIVKPMNLQLD